MQNYDLIVVGGGLSGVCAAVSGAREGLNVLLIEKSGYPCPCIDLLTPCISLVYFINIPYNSLSDGILLNSAINFCLSKAKLPATKGQEKEVPSTIAYLLFGYAVNIPLPGATKSTNSLELLKSVIA